ncbi:MAG: hypothetical protein ABW136_12350 [Steroidobacteraceae bacterium]
MSPFRIAFDSMAWEALRDDVRQKVHCADGRQVRLVEFDTTDGFEQWCEVGHVGYVLEGGLTISFDGTPVRFSRGDGLLIPDGVESRHRAVSIDRGTLLLMIEDVE